jgi:hypothetical protein
MGHVLGSSEARFGVSRTVAGRFCLGRWPLGHLCLELALGDRFELPDQLAARDEADCCVLYRFENLLLLSFGHLQSPCSSATTLLVTVTRK